MPEEIAAGCARPTGGPVGEKPPQGKGEGKVRESPEKQEESPMLMVGRKVPDFSAPAYHNGKFVHVKLSEFLGKWVLLCFYPGDFTFV